jgi:hypothetical protein
MKIIPGLGSGSEPRNETSGAKDSRQKGQVEAYEGNVAGKWLPDRSKQWTAANPPILSDQSDSFGAGGCTNEPIN